MVFLQKVSQNIASTRWRSLADHRELVYYFETVFTPDTFWINFKNIDFRKGSGIRKLPLENNETYGDDVLSSFKEAGAFKFLGI